MSDRKYLRESAHLKKDGSNERLNSSVDMNKSFERSVVLGSGGNRGSGIRGSANVSR